MSCLGGHDLHMLRHRWPINGQSSCKFNRKNWFFHRQSTFIWSQILRAKTLDFKPLDISLDVVIDSWLWMLESKQVTFFHLSCAIRIVHSLNGAPVLCLLLLLFNDMNVGFVCQPARPKWCRETHQNLAFEEYFLISITQCKRQLTTVFIRIKLDERVKISVRQDSFLSYSPLFYLWLVQPKSSSSDKGFMLLIYTIILVFLLTAAAVCKLLLCLYFYAIIAEQNVSDSLCLIHCSVIKMRSLTLCMWFMCTLNEQHNN